MKIKFALIAIPILLGYLLYRGQRTGPVSVLSSPVTVFARSVENPPAPASPQHTTSPLIEKVDVIDAAFVSEDAAALAKAEELVRAMVRNGSAAEAFAAIPKVTQFSQDFVEEVVSLQSSLCRFKDSPNDEFGFELIKMKFDLVLGNEPNFKPWQSVCGPG